MLQSTARAQCCVFFSGAPWWERPLQSFSTTGESLSTIRVCGRSRTLYRVSRSHCRATLARLPLRLFISDQCPGLSCDHMPVSDVFKQFQELCQRGMCKTLGGTIFKIKWVLVEEKRGKLLHKDILTSHCLHCLLKKSSICANKEVCYIINIYNIFCLEINLIICVEKK